MFIEFDGFLGGRLIIRHDSIVAIASSTQGEEFAAIDIGNGDAYVVRHSVDEVVALMRKADEAKARDALEKTTL